MDVTNRDRLSVLQTMYEVIKESHEHIYIHEGKDYFHFIEGVLAMTRKQIKEIDERPIGEPEPYIDHEEAKEALDSIKGIYNTYVNAKLGE